MMRKIQKDPMAAKEDKMPEIWDPKIKVYGIRPGNPKVFLTQPVTADELKVLKRLELLTGDGCGDWGMVGRRHLRASFDTMQTLCLKGLVDGRGLRDAKGVGNTPDSSLWGITRLGRRALGDTA